MSQWTMTSIDLLVLSALVCVAIVLLGRSKR